MSEDPNVQSFYRDGVSYQASVNAGQWQAQYNPSYTPGQEPNESWAAYQNRVNAQASASGNSSSGK